RTFEEINLTLAPDTQTRQKLEDRYIQRRTNEVISLLHLQRAERVSFEGVIETQTSQEWQINGIPVVLSLDTRILGPAEIGMTIEITGTTQSDGKVLAHELRIRQFHLIGIVESITPEQWTIEGIPIQINEQTSLDPHIRAKDQVIALLEPEDDGNYTALIVVQLSPASRETLLTPSVK
ncbi:MAG: hypothetical protein GTO14_09630, partial [Anaerolineales bacterium]|nr:hypothetical protein [Anaerolineales bacterium]